MIEQTDMTLTISFQIEITLEELVNSGVDEFERRATELVKERLSVLRAVEWQRMNGNQPVKQAIVGEVKLNERTVGVRAESEQGAVLRAGDVIGPDTSKPNQEDDNGKAKRTG